MKNQNNQIFQFTEQVLQDENVKEAIYQTAQDVAEEYGISDEQGFNAILEKQRKRAAQILTLMHAKLSNFVLRSVKIYLRNFYYFVWQILLLSLYSLIFFILQNFIMGFLQDIADIVQKYFHTGSPSGHVERSIKAWTSDDISAASQIPY